MHAEDRLRHLAKIIDQQFSLMREMVGILKEENQAIETFDLNAVDRCCKIKDACNCQLERLDGERSRVLGQVAEERQIEVEALTLSRLKEIYPENATVAAITCAFTSCEDQVRNYRYELARNKELIQFSLASVQGALDAMLNEAHREDISYTPSGTLRRPHAVESLLKVSI